MDDENTIISPRFIEPICTRPEQ